MIPRGPAMLCLLAILCPAPARAAPDAKPAADEEARFRTLFERWKDKEDPAAAAHPASRRGHGGRPSKREDGLLVTSGMGMRRNPLLGRDMLHAGADLAAPSGLGVRATADGTVLRAGWAGSYGLLVTLRHQGDYETRYAHLSRILVSSGTPVRKGQLIGYVGSTGRSTGPHLHYEVRRQGRPLDPLPFLGR